MLRVLARPLLPLALLVSVYLFLRGTTRRAVASLPAW